MASMNISLPEQMKAWVEAQVATGRYANVSDYMRDLLRKEQERHTSMASLRREIQKGVDSGISSRSIDDIIASGLDKAKMRGSAAE